MEALPENLDTTIPTTHSSMINTSDYHFGVVDSEALSCNFEVSSYPKYISLAKQLVVAIVIARECS